MAFELMSEAYLKGRISYSVPTMSDAGGAELFDNPAPNAPTGLVNEALSTYRTYSTWNHVAMGGDLYRVETDESGSWATLVDDIASQAHQRNWEERKTANYRVRSKRSGVLSDPTSSVAIQTNTRVMGSFRSGGNPVTGVEIIAMKESNNAIIATGTTSSEIGHEGEFDIEMDNTWPYTASVIASGKPADSINGGILVGVPV